MIRVLHLINSLHVGGAERLLLNIVRRIDRERFSCAVAYLIGGGDLEPDFRETGWPIYDLSTRDGRFTLWSLLRLRRIFREGGYDILHTHLVHATLLGRLLRRAGGVPRLVTTRHFPHGEYRTSLPYLAHRFTNRWDDRIVAVSAHIRQSMIEREHVPALKIVNIYNGVDTDRFHPGVAPAPRPAFGLAPGEPVVGIVANLRPVKGVDVFLRAAREVHRAVPEARFLIVGDGPEAGRLRALARELGLAGVVRFAGRVMDVPPVMALMDVVVLASHHEAFSITVAEAMAMERPVVATRVGGVAELIEHDADGLLVAPGDPQAMAEAVVRLLRDKDLAHQIGKSARRSILEQYSIAQTIARLRAVYEELMATPRPARGRKNENS